MDHAIEAGLGGRHDATNVIDARVVLLTNVGLEHTEWLGETREAIAREKLAVAGDVLSDAVVDTLGGLDAVPVAEHVAVFEAAHQAVLAVEQQGVLDGRAGAGGGRRKTGGEERSRWAAGDRDFR